jgi:hypothetical protein
VSKGTPDHEQILSAPYAAITGVQSASRDKQQASRSVRRRINQWLHIQCAKGGEFELVPHRLECQHNDVWCWDRDGKQRLQLPNARDWSCHCLEVNGLRPFEDGRWRDEEWPPRWYERVRRK